MNKTMIREMKKDQEQKLNEYKDKWSKISLSTERIDEKEGIEICNNVQEILLKRKKTPVIFVRSPIEAWVSVCMSSQDFDQLYSEVVWQVDNQIWKQVWCRVRNQVLEQVKGQVLEQVKDKVADQVIDQLYGKVKNQVNEHYSNFINPWLLGNNDSAVFAFYDFMQNEIKVESDLWEKFNIWKETSKLGIIFPLNDICIVSEKPTHINIVGCSPSVEFADGFIVS